MGLLRRQNQKLNKVTQDKIERYKEEISKINQKYGMRLVPVIGRYGAEFEIEILDPDKSPSGIEPATKMPEQNK